MPEESVPSRLKSLPPFEVVRAPHLRGCCARWLRPTPGQPSACAGAQRSARTLPPWWAVPTDSRCPLRCGSSCPSSHVALPAAVAPEHPSCAPLPPLATSVQPQPCRAELWAAPLGLPRRAGGAARAVGKVWRWGALPG